jgi:hypothetical protein
MMRGVIALAGAVLLTATAAVRGAEPARVAASPWGGVYALPGGRIMCIGGASNMATRCPHCRRWSGMDRWN